MRDAAGEKLSTPKALLTAENAEISGFAEESEISIAKAANN